MKMEHYGDYSGEDTSRSESILLTVWAALGDLTSDLVLVGGLVPRYICRRNDSALQAVTMDVDLAVSLGISSGMYDTTRKRMRDVGFEWKDKRFVKSMGQTSLFLDFIADKPGEDAPDSVMVDDIPVSAVYGVSRALELNRVVKIVGRDLLGASVAECVKVCEVGPYLCLKLLAYRNRAQSKDVFDAVRAVVDYDGGTEAAVAAFRAESGINLAYESVMGTLIERFANERSKGPVQYGEFCTGSVSNGWAGDADFYRQQFVNEAVDVARALLG